MLLVKIINLNYSIELFYIYDKIINTNAGIVQRLECGLAKAKMPVRFRLLAPKAKIVEILTFIHETQLKY